jgi:hypothetical protein
MYTRHQAESDRSPDGLCDLSLVHRSQTGFLRVIYATHLAHILGHHGIVLRGLVAVR